ncbi:MAG: OmpA family protein [Alphaproteobacteria bacterium]|nr:OmpA family protein [Alphaproteobacteria bacterium]
MMPPKRHRPEENVDAWLMTYADMITLLLAFFIIFVATSEPKQERFEAATKGMHDYFAGFSMDSPFDGAMREVQGIVASRNAERTISAEKTRRGMTIELASLPLFAPGSADILAAKLSLLEELAGVLNAGELSRAAITVEGHTDGDPGTAKNRWELGAQRAAAVADALALRGIDPKRIRVTSVGDTAPLVPGTDAEGHPIPENQARNSRVIIRVEQ